MYELPFSTNADGHVAFCVVDDEILLFYKSFGTNEWIPMSTEPMKPPSGTTWDSLDVADISDFIFTNFDIWVDPSALSHNPCPRQLKRLKNRKNDTRTPLGEYSSTNRRNQLGDSLGSMIPAPKKVINHEPPISTISAFLEYIQYGIHPMSFSASYYPPMKFGFFGENIKTNVAQWILPKSRSEFFEVTFDMRAKRITDSQKLDAGTKAFSILKQIDVIDNPIQAVNFVNQIIDRMDNEGLDQTLIEDISMILPKLIRNRTCISAIGMLIEKIIVLGDERSTSWYVTNKEILFPMANILMLGVLSCYTIAFHVTQIANKLRNNFHRLPEMTHDPFICTFSHIIIYAISNMVHQDVGQDRYDASQELTLGLMALESYSFESSVFLALISVKNSLEKHPLTSPPWIYQIVDAQVFLTNGLFMEFEEYFNKVLDDATEYYAIVWILEYIKTMVKIPDKKEGICLSMIMFLINLVTRIENHEHMSFLKHLVVEALQKLIYNARFKNRETWGQISRFLKPIKLNMHELHRGHAFLYKPHALILSSKRNDSSRSMGLSALEQYVEGKYQNAPINIQSPIDKEKNEKVLEYMSGPVEQYQLNIMAKKVSHCPVFKKIVIQTIKKAENNPSLSFAAGNALSTLCLSGTLIEGQEFRNIVFENAILIGSTFHRNTFFNCTFKSCFMFGSVIRDCFFFQCNMESSYIGKSIDRDFTRAFFFNFMGGHMERRRTPRSTNTIYIVEHHDRYANHQLVLTTQGVIAIWNPLAGNWTAQFETAHEVLCAFECKSPNQDSSLLITLSNYTVLVCSTILRHNMNPISKSRLDLKGRELYNGTVLIATFLTEEDALKFMDNTPNISIDVNMHQRPESFAIQSAFMECTFRNQAVEQFIANEGGVVVRIEGVEIVPTRNTHQNNADFFSCLMMLYGLDDGYEKRPKTGSISQKLISSGLFLEYMRGFKRHPLVPPFIAERIIDDMLTFMEEWKKKPYSSPILPFLAEIYEYGIRVEINLELAATIYAFLFIAHGRCVSDIKRLLGKCGSKILNRIEHIVINQQGPQLNIGEVFWTILEHHMGTSPTPDDFEKAAIFYSKLPRGQMDYIDHFKIFVQQGRSHIVELLEYLASKKDSFEECKYIDIADLLREVYEKGIRRPRDIESAKKYFEMVLEKNQQETWEKLEKRVLAQSKGAVEILKGILCLKDKYNRLKYPDLCKRVASNPDFKKTESLGDRDWILLGKILIENEDNVGIEIFSDLLERRNRDAYSELCSLALRSSEMGAIMFPLAGLMLCRCYINGWIVRQDLNEAVKKLVEYATNGSLYAVSELAKLSKIGNSAAFDGLLGLCRKNLETSVSRQVDVELGQGYIEGWAGDINLEEAAHYFGIASKKGSREAVQRLSHMAFKGSWIAAYYLREVSSANQISFVDPNTQVQLESMEKDGLFVESSILQTKKITRIRSLIRSQSAVGLLEAENMAKEGMKDGFNILAIFASQVRMEPSEFQKQGLLALARCHENGWGTAKSLISAFNFYSLAEPESAELWEKVRTCLDKGYIGVYQWIQQASEAKEKPKLQRRAARELSYCFCNGLFNPVDYTRALHLLQKAVALGLNEAVDDIVSMAKGGCQEAFDVALELTTTRDLHKPISLTAAKSLASLLKKEPQGDESMEISLSTTTPVKPPAQHLKMLVSMIHHGQNLSLFEDLRDLVQRGDTDAFRELEELAKMKRFDKTRYPSAAIIISECYENGWTRSVDALEACKWRIIGDPDADEPHGRLWSEIQKGNERAFGILKELAEDLIVTKPKYPKAAYLIGKCYEEGIGVEADVERAVCFYVLSSKGGHKSAKARVRSLSSTNPN